MISVGPPTYLSVYISTSIVFITSTHLYQHLPVHYITNNPPPAWVTLNITYGLYLSDTTILSPQEMELVVLPAIMMQNLRDPTYWHLRASLRVGIEREEVEAVHRVIELVAEYGGRVLDVPRVGDVDDA